MVKSKHSDVVDILGEENYEQLIILAFGRAISLKDIIQQGLNNAFEEGGFDAQGAEAVREPWDDDPDDHDNIRIQSLIGMDNYHRLVDHARARGVSNADALRVGISWALQRGEI